MGTEVEWPNSHLINVSSQHAKRKKKQLIPKKKLAKKTIHKYPLKKDDKIIRFVFY